MTTPRNQQRFTNPQSPAPSNDDGNAELLASASADSGDGNPSTEVEVSGDDDASPLMQAAVAQESDTAGAFLQQGANDTEDHNAVSTMMDDQNSTDSSLVAFDSQADEEELDMDTGERPSREPPGQALAGLLKKLRSKTEDTPPEPAPPPQDTDGDGEPDATDTDDDNDGVVDQDDDRPRDFDNDGRNDDEPAPTRGQLDLSGIPSASGSPELADIGQESRVSSREMVDPRYRSSAAKNDLSLPTGESPYRRRGGRGKAARRERLRFNQGTGRTPR